MNTQKQIKQELDRNGLTKDILINEIFYTIQGEGPYSGKPAVFIRLAGCNLQCAWCDTEYTKSEEMNLLLIGLKVASLFKKSGQDLSRLVVITGGEPFRQDISHLCTRLIAMQYTVQIETNGALSNEDFPWDKVDVVASPKVKYIHPDILKHAKYFKYVISSDDEKSITGTPLFGTQINQGGGRPRTILEGKQIYLTPLDSKDKEQNYLNLNTTLELCLKFGYNINIQIHKLLNVR